METDQLEAWLEAYGDAWERKDTAAFVRLFSPDVRYWWTPFEAPKQGRTGVAQAFDAAVARQESIQFSATPLAALPGGGIAIWHCGFGRVGTGRRVHLSGVFVMEFDDDGLCSAFREWWHSDETT